jgi:hypothetical protein
MPISYQRRPTLKRGFKTTGRGKLVRSSRAIRHKTKREVGRTERDMRPKRKIRKMR